MSAVDQTIAVLFGDKVLAFDVLSYATYLPGATSEWGDFPIIVAKCAYHQGIHSNRIPVGPEGKYLDNLAASIRIQAASAKTDTTSSEQRSAGLLVYHAPISPEGLAGLSTKVIEEGAAGSVSGNVVLGPAAIMELSRLLSTRANVKYQLLVEVKAKSTVEPNCLQYDSSAQYRWHGDPLVVHQASILVTEAPREVEADVQPASEPSQSDLLLAKIAEAVHRLDQRVQQAGYLIIAVAIIAAFLLLRK